MVRAAMEDTVTDQSSAIQPATSSKETDLMRVFEKIGVELGRYQLDDEQLKILTEIAAEEAGVSAYHFYLSTKSAANQAFLQLSDSVAELVRTYEGEPLKP